MNAEAEVVAPDQAMVSLVSKAELDQQIETARSRPRSIASFRKEALALATIDADTADECIYALPRAGKTIEGPSIRFAEILLYCWTNTRAGTRIIEEGREFLTAQGVFHDLERNTALTREVKRRITTSRGERYSSDMIGTTANAASSIALRNAVFNGVPRALWWSIYLEVRRVVAGEAKTHATKRAETLAALQKVGVTTAMVLAKYGYAGVDDITTDNIVELRGARNAIRDGDIKIEEAFAPKDGETTAPPARPSRTEQAKEHLRSSRSEPAAAGADLAGYVPLFSAESAVEELRLKKTTRVHLDAAYEVIKLDFKKTGRPVPVEVEGMYRDLSEALAQGGATS